MQKLKVEHDGFDLIQKKIIMSKVSIDMCSKQVELSHIEGKLSLYLAGEAKKKRAIVEKTVPLLETMLKGEVMQYDLDYYTTLCKEINELDEHIDEDIAKLVKQRRDLVYELQGLQKKYESMAATIPDTQVITNYILYQKPANSIDPSMLEPID